MLKSKKIVSGLLAILMATSAFAGCSNTTESGSTTPAATTTDANGGTPEPAGTTAGDETSAPETTTAENTITGPVDKEDAFYVWGWNDDVKKILDGPFQEDYPDLYSRIVFVNTGGSDNYQAKLDAMLDTPDNAQYPDLIALEADYILKYTDSDDTLSMDDLGITAADYAGQYKYTVDIATVDGVVKALSWQACPGGWLIRKSLAESLLGASTPEAIQEYFSSWDKVLETAATVKEKSGGATKLLSGMDDVFRVYMAARQQAWVTDDTLTVDDSMLAYMDFAKTLYDNDYTYQTSQWSDEWNANKKGNKVIAWPGCTWYTYWTTDADNFGDYVLVEGPQEYYWGGTWLAATSSCSDKEMAATIMKYFTCESESMKKINALNSDYINNKAAVQELIDAGKGGAALEGKTILADDQNYLEFFLPLADKVSVDTMTAEDMDINSAFSVQVQEYAKGNKDKDTAIADFRKAVADKFNYIS